MRGAGRGGLLAQLAPAAGCHRCQLLLGARWGWAGLGGCWTGPGWWGRRGGVTTPRRGPTARPHPIAAAAAAAAVAAGGAADLLRLIAVGCKAVRDAEHGQQLGQALAAGGLLRHLVPLLRIDARERGQAGGRVAQQGERGTACGLSSPDVFVQDRARPGAGASAWSSRNSPVPACSARPSGRPSIIGMHPTCMRMLLEGARRRCQNEWSPPVPRERCQGGAMQSN
jgi:hypothetical protein